MKRIFDFTFSLIGIILLSPILIWVALVIRFSSNGPVLYRQVRVGQNGKLFTLVKFRSMNNNDLNTNTISVKGDARITKFGAIIRRFKLDELPELWNVIKGDMSLVGPRPDVQGYADKLKGEDRNILKLKPGITGLASLKYANEEELLAKQDDPIKYNDEVVYPDKVRINLDYYNNHNLIGDIKIIFFTIFRKNY